MNLLRPTTEEDVDYLSVNLRSEDREEAEAHGLPCHTVLLHGLHKSTVCYTLIDPGTGLPGAVLGVAPSHYPDLGAIWLLGTPAIERNPVTFLRQSKPTLVRLYEETGYEGLYNFTYGKNTLHHKWLRWLGFTFIAERRLGQNSDLFYEFIKLKG